MTSTELTATHHEAEQAVRDLIVTMGQASDELARQVNHLAAAAQAAAEILEHLTVNDFAKGGDRAARESLVWALNRCGRATVGQVAEYGAGE